MKLEVKEDTQSSLSQPTDHLGTCSREQLESNLDTPEGGYSRNQGEGLGGIAVIEGQDQQIGGVEPSGDNRKLGQNA